MKPKRLTLRLYRDANAQFRWTLLSGSRKLANSGEGYLRRPHMLKAACLTLGVTYLNFNLSLISRGIVVDDESSHPIKR
jgi:hypothetical protein